MKTLRCLLILLLFMTPFALPGSILAQTKGDGFQPFYQKFRAAVRSRDKSALKILTGARFIWAEDGEISSDEAFRNIGRIVTWNKFWQSAQKAVAKSAPRCVLPSCDNRAGYHASAAVPFPVELLFEKDARGNWHWTGFLGD